jgi:hypothetical protein
MIGYFTFSIDHTKQSTSTLRAITPIHEDEGLSIS